MYWGLYLNDLVMQWNCCIYSLSLQCGLGHLITGPRGASCSICCFMSAFLYCPSPTVFANEHAASLICLLNRCKIQVLTCTNKSLFWVLVCLFLLEGNY